MNLPSTSEFRQTAASLLALLLCGFFVHSPLVLVGADLVAVSYILSRARAKQFRGVLVEKPGKDTSEFLVALVAALVPLAWILTGYPMDLVLAGGGIVVAAYNHGRGVTKTLNPNPAAKFPGVGRPL